MSTSGDDAGTFCPPSQRVFVLMASILASSMAFIDGSVVSIATPAIRTDLGASLADAQWVSNAYMLPLAALLLIGGAAGDRFGLRKVFGFGIALFVLASALCAIAGNAPMLIAARALQGLGAAFMVPGSLALIAKAYPRDERGGAIGIWATASSLTTIGGPVIGGFMLTLFGDASWRLVFAINLPLGLAALALLFLRVPADPAADGRRLDLVGGLLVAAALFLIAFGLTGSDGAAPAPGHIVMFGGAGLVLFALFLVWEQRRSAPMLPLRLFANRSFSGANGLTFALYFSLSATLFYLPMMLISGWGASPADVSLALTPFGLVLTVLSGFSGKLSDRYGPAPLITLGSVLVAFAFAGMALFAQSHDLWRVLLPLNVLLGLGMGLVVSPLSTAVMTALDDADSGIASGVNNAVSRMAGLVAIAAMGAVAALAFAAHGGIEGMSFGAGPVAGADAGAEAARIAATDAGFSAVAWCTSALSLVSAAIAWLTLEHKR